MRALVLRQPWANLVRDGLKKIEVRSWETGHRGDLLICAAKRPNPDLEYDGNLPLGATICVVTVTDCRLLRRADCRPAMLGPDGWLFNEGAFAWVLANPRRLVPRPTVGKLGLFDVPSDLIVPA
ncbi:MAG TPA: ASCH domain-containing protein [Casimicrobiaceae bacterium]